jgi:thiol-disulfide isomerase/thioredoxin
MPALSLPLLVAALLCAPLAARGEGERPIPVRPGTDAAALIAELGQGRPLLLHFWATWCEACRDEFPKLRALLLGLPARGMAVGLVSIDRPDQLAEVRKQLEGYGVAALPSFLLDAPQPDPVAKALHEPRWDGALPATFLFDARGKRVRSFIGAADAKKLERAVRRLLRATSATPQTAPPKG